ncbi:AraC family transcriptional regulator [Ochrovirga pacifica]|uniref:AraC family transcriptional regulator n=1 Tax=Ochrovirga pacifica TaxID=1042376 RepID=UPI000255836A|nr:helix-turn-helix transcriptional regulator [Ochrovirga pacifica]
MIHQIPDISFKNKTPYGDFELIELSELFQRIFDSQNHNPTLAHKIDFFALLLVTNGFGTHTIDLKTHQLKQGSIVKISKGQVHAFQKKPTYKGYLILFTEEFLFRYFSPSSIQLIAHLYNYHIAPAINSDKKLNHVFITQLQEEIRYKTHYAYKNIIASILEIYLLKLERKNPHQHLTPKNTKDYSTFLQFKNLVETKCHQTRNVKDYAKNLQLSTKRLNEVVKKATLNTAKIFIDNYVILEIKREIASTNKSLKEISFAMGFDEVTNFTKFFKKKTGHTPKSFKNSFL